MKHRSLLAPLVLCLWPCLSLAQSTIEETALGLFLRQGYEHTSIQDIADAVKMSPRTFFRVFSDTWPAWLT